MVKEVVYIHNKSSKIGLYHKRFGARVTVEMKGRNILQHVPRWDTYLSFPFFFPQYLIAAPVGIDVGMLRCRTKETINERYIL